MYTPKTAQGLVAWAKGLLGQPYWYGTCCYDCTTALLTSKTKQYPGHYTDARKARYQDDIKQGKTCADCVGLIKGYMWWDDEQQRQRYKLGGFPDSTATGVYNLAVKKGPLATLPEVPGLLVWRSGHIGIYIGGGEVIEARGFNYGIVRTKLAQRDFTNWCECPYLIYGEIVEPLRHWIGRVGTKTGNGISVWDSPSKNKQMIKVPEGAEVEVTGLPDKDGFVPATYGGKSGVCDAQYLGFVRAVDDGEVSAETPKAWRGHVKTKTGGGINLWTSNAKVSKVCAVPEGALVEVLDQADGKGFAQARYGTKTGLADTQYLVYYDSMEGEQAVRFTVTIPDITADEVDRIVAAYPGAVVEEHRAGV